MHMNAEDSKFGFPSIINNSKNQEYMYFVYDDYIYIVDLLYVVNNTFG